jgi:transposase
MTELRYCKQCFEKQQQINKLKTENERLRAMLRQRERSAKEGPFGSGTPSSKVPFKANALSERQDRRGGGKPGHVGHGRRRVQEAQADRVETVAVEMETCPECGLTLRSEGRRERTVTDLIGPKVENILYRLERRVCPKCGRRFGANAPGVLPRCLYSNAFLAHVAVQHYLWGVPLGRIEQQTGVGYGALVQGQKQLACLMEGATEKLIAEYRQSPVKHADETGWRTDGENGYAWLFATPTISLFRFRQSRSATVAAEVLGTKPLPGVLVVDRYHAYNKAPAPLQYCYGHLKRDVEDIEKQFPDQGEVAAFVRSLAPTLGEAMHLRTLRLSRNEFCRRAARIKRRIIAIAHRQASHPAIWKVQEVFRKNPKRLYHWTRAPTIPAENNLAERDLRPLVIARKVSFGSQSEAGARTRETLMTILHTLKKRAPACAVAAALQSALDRLAVNPSLDPWTLLFNPCAGQRRSSDQD